jgi:hypothetical protein
VPDLQPVYQGGHRPQPGAGSFVIRMWQLQRQRWLLSRAGGSTLMDRMGSNPSWQFFNVTVESYVPPDCFAAAVVQVRALRCLLAR